MIIQPDYKQINVLIDDLTIKISNYHNLRNFVYYGVNRYKNVSISAFISRGVLREKTLKKGCLSKQKVKSLSRKYSGEFIGKCARKP